jgi:phage host-nuclease inhibitor protein Gam
MKEEYTSQELEEATALAIAELEQGQTEADLEKVEAALRKLSQYAAYANEQIKVINEKYAPMRKALQKRIENLEYRIQEYRSRN